MADIFYQDGQSQPVHSIFCIGKNYLGHIKEGTCHQSAQTPQVPEQPVVFMKPDTCIIHHKDCIELPAVSHNVQHEAEMVVALKSGGRFVPKDEALACVGGIGVGIDVTARDIRNELSKQGYPWLVGKGFDTFAPVSDFICLEKLDVPLDALTVELTVNDELRQQGNTNEMLFSVAELIHYLSSVFTLQAGDLIFTGTPAGVNQFDDGDTLVARLTAESEKPDQPTLLCELEVAAKDSSQAG